MGKRESEELADGKERQRQKRSRNGSLHVTIRATLLALALWLIWSASLLISIEQGKVSIEIGEPSPQDIKAPRDITYVSDVQTKEAQVEAASQVSDIYSSADPAIAAQQIEMAREVADQIWSVRQDTATSDQQKLELLTELPDIALSQSAAETVLDIEEREWRQLVTESLRIVTTVMREEIRPYQVREARQEAERLVNADLPADQRQLAVNFAQGALTANSFFQADETIQQRMTARNSVDPVFAEIRAGEAILREGQIADELAYEKLRVLGLLESGRHWHQIVGILLLTSILTVCISIYIPRLHPLLLERPRRELLLVLALASVAISAHLIIPGHTLMPYLFPAAAAAMLVAIFLDLQLALVVSLVNAIIVGFAGNNSLALTTYVLFGSIVGALSLWRSEQLGAFLKAMVFVGLTNAATIVGLQLRSGSYDMRGLLELAGVGLLNSVLASSITFVAYSFTGRLFGITTPLQLMELARPTHPLLRQLLIKAPGTYHHSIVISNMAERAAEAIGADALLARVGSYYHDIGKLSRPYFFSENQSEAENPHDKLDPKTSTEIIISHVTDGLDLARKYRLPDKIRDFIAEHHGTTLVSYFYRQACQEDQDDNTDKEAFRYPGPKPQSKETAIVMLADTIEAWSRANRPPNDSEMERRIRQVINDRLVSGQLDECDLTLKDLDGIRKAFASVLKGIFHPRIQYPERVTSSHEQNGP